MKLARRFAAFGAAMAMAVSMMSVCASAAYPTCTSSQQSKTLWKATTSVSSSTTSTSVSGTGFYYLTTTTYSAVGNGSGGPGGCTMYLTSPAKHGWYRVYTSHSATGYDTKTLFNAGTYVS